MRYFNDKIHKTLKIKARSRGKDGQAILSSVLCFCTLFCASVSEGLRITKGLLVPGHCICDNIFVGTNLNLS